MVEKEQGSKSIILGGLESFLMFSGCFLNLLLGSGFQLLSSLFPLVSFYLLGCKLVHIALRQTMLAYCPQKQLIGFQKSTLFYYVLFFFRLWRL